MAIRTIVRGPSGGGVPNAGYVSRQNANPVYIDGSADTMVFGTGTSGTSTKTVADTTSVQTLQGKTLASADGVVKVLPVTSSKAFTSGSALSVFTTTSATLLGASGLVFWSIFVTDGTDVQIDTFHTTYSAVNKGGTSTVTHTYVSAEEAKAVSAGTLTTTATAVDSGSGVATFKITPTTSLTATTATVTYTIFPLIGAVTLL